MCYVLSAAILQFKLELGLICRFALVYHKLVDSQKIYEDVLWFFFVFVFLDILKGLNENEYLQYTRDVSSPGTHVFLKKIYSKLDKYNFYIMKIFLFIHTFSTCQHKYGSTW